MSCPRCGHKIEKGWNFCPFCGYRPDKSPPAFSGTFGGIMDKLMKKLAKQMESIDRESRDMDRDIQVMDLSPMFKEMGGMDMEKMQKNLKVMGKPGARGFTIRISRTNDNQPKVNVDTFGNMDEAMQNQIKEQLKHMGIKLEVRPRKQGESPRPSARQKKRPTEPKRKALPTPKYTEEPKASVRRIDSKVLVDIEIPGVKSEDDIDINELESSVEVRAMAGDKAYFKIFTKPAQFSLSKQDFKNGRLHLEFA
jgi:HSP20 family molecular chaperone IbpA